MEEVSMKVQQEFRSSIPTLGAVHGHPVFVVDGKPFILLAGEVHNSSSSSLEYMEQVWEKAEVLGMNCLLLPVTWELVEPEEGCFDFSLVQGLIEQARAHSMKIAFLWFGAWKNAQCYYAPAWVKTDTRRFRRAEIEKGKGFIRIKDFYDMPYTSLLPCWKKDDLKTAYGCGDAGSTEMKPWVMHIPNRRFCISKHFCTNDPENRITGFCK